jgi:hypothetical protein
MKNESEMLKELKGPFLLKDMGTGVTLYAGWNKTALAPALKRVTGTTIFECATMNVTLTVGGAAMFAGAM